MNKYVLFLILLVGFILRLYNFWLLPPGLNQDEASIGYDTYSIIHEGMIGMVITFRFNLKRGGPDKMYYMGI
jgi:hypothetical protein